MRRFALALIALAATPVMAEDLEFTLINNSSLKLVEMYVSPHEAEEWGENILAVPAVEPGTQGQISIADGEEVCDYDLRFVMDNGNDVSGTQNLCELATFTLND
ncbi:hypothetical protein NX862_00735 [Rhodobacter sp. KR11]|jgi:hypothetical protein|uniref:hypothetical protein n=1 Tax=Rhodobacter sp. KR11 TaxID=2974588 RepID=UPI0022220755|nr:hypothetical protein [Rhodobacter sp. KR11]MCW1917272.1 hypothetical protein [Rhodobacter sp. KR11]